MKQEVETQHTYCLRDSSQHKGEKSGDICVIQCQGYLQRKVLKVLEYIIHAYTENVNSRAGACEMFIV